MRLIDADYALEDARLNYGGVYDAVLMKHFLDRQPTIEDVEEIQTNDPMSLEELREMDGEPAYFQFGDGAQGWAIVEKDVSGIILYGPDFDDHTYPDDDFINMEYNDPVGHFGLHVLGWRAYRRKPKEGTT